MIIAIVVLSMVVAGLIVCLIVLGQTVKKNYDVLSMLIDFDHKQVKKTDKRLVEVEQTLLKHVGYIDSIATDVNEITIGIQVLVEKIIELREAGAPESQISDMELRLQAAIAARQSEFD